MVALTSTAKFHIAVIDRVLEGPYLTKWAVVRTPPGRPVVLHLKDQPDTAYAVGNGTVERGTTRCLGGQGPMQRPRGITREMVAEISLALGELDAELLTPATADALIQVGLFGEVRYP